jgi:hypothetical protein
MNNDSSSGANGTIAFFSEGVSQALPYIYLLFKMDQCILASDVSVLHCGVSSHVFAFKG